MGSEKLLTPLETRHKEKLLAAAVASALEKLVHVPAPAPDDIVFSLNDKTRQISRRIIAKG